MTRLTHSFSAYLRYMQMSGHQLFVFVEGKKTDPYFYDRICCSVCRTAGVSYQIRRSQELAKGIGGKQALLCFFEYLRSKSALVDVFKGKSTGVLFFLDKDVDDFLRTQRCSPHVVYTYYYDVENHIFLEADLVDAAAASASLDHQEVLASITGGEGWRSGVAERWKEWVTLCLFVAKKKVNCESNYRVPSRINNPTHGPVDQAAYRQCQERIQTRLGLTERKFKRSFRRVAGLVDAIYAQGEHDRVFKGKWYPLVLAATVRDGAGGQRVNPKGLAGRITSCAALTLDFDAPWAEHFKQPLRDLIRQL